MKAILLMMGALFVFGCGSHMEEKILVERESFFGVTLAISEKADSLDYNEKYSFFKDVKQLDSKKKEQLIKELLLYKNDSTRIAGTVVSYNKNLSQFYLGSLSSVKVQIDALFKINQVYFDNPFYYSPFAILIDTLTKKEINSDQNAIAEVYSYYEAFFKRVRRQGFQNMKSNGLVPLTGSKFRWLYGIDVSPLMKMSFEIE